MGLLARVCISWCIVAMGFGEPNNQSESIELSTKSLKDLYTTVTAWSNASAQFVNVPHRRAVLVINDPTAPAKAPTSNTSINHQALRSTKKIDIKCLKYVEFDEQEKDKVLNTVFMYNMKDVADFFYTYLDTRICNVVCPPENLNPPK